MKVEEICKLLDAGYTKEEITAMEKPEEKKEEQKKEAPEEKKEEQKKEAPEEKKEEQKKEAPVENDTIAKLIEQNNKLLKTITDLQSDNIKNAKQESGNNKPQNASDVIKDFFKTL